MSTSNTAGDATDGISNVSPAEDNDNGEQKTMSTTKDQACERPCAKQNDLDLECCICLENLPKDPTKFVRFTCCGQGMHKHCTTDLVSTKMAGSCPLCRAKTPTSHEEMVKYIRPWVKKKKAWAQIMMAQKYYHGEGVKHSYEMARILFERAAQQGDVTAMYNLGVMYEKGLGVEQSYEKAFEHYEQAAHLGYVKAQYNLGVLYYNGDGMEQNIAKAKEWLTKAKAQGYEAATQALKVIHMDN
jgi:TPR repeat protein